MTIYTPYTYLIGWTTHNKWYYGVRYSKKCNPSDLWVKYFTSSDYVRSFREEHGEPDVIQIRKTFSDDNSARLWEMKVLQRMRVLTREDFLNAAISLSMSPKSASKAGISSGQKRTKEQKLEIGRKASKRRVENTTREQRSEWGKKGMKLRWDATSEEARSEFARSVAQSIPLETCVNCGVTLRKNQITRFHNEKCKVDVTKKKHPQFSKEWMIEHSLTCEHCGRSNLTPTNYKRWHGDNCKRQQTHVRQR